MSEIIDDGSYVAGTEHVDASVWPTATTWGLISAAVGFVITLVQYNAGGWDIDQTTGQPGASAIWTIISTVASIVLIYLGLKSYRDKANQGVLTLGRGVLWSLAFGVIAGLLSALLVFVFFSVIAPDIVDQMSIAQENLLEEQGLTGAELETARSMTSMFTSPLSFALFSAIGSVIFSLIIGLVVSLVVKTR